MDFLENIIVLKISCFLILELLDVSSCAECFLNFAQNDDHLNIFGGLELLDVFHNIGLHLG